jgi:hypothetical protein
MEYRVTLTSAFPSQAQIFQNRAKPGQAGPREIKGKSLELPWILLAVLNLFKGLRRPPRPKILLPLLSPPTAFAGLSGEQANIPRVLIFTNEKSPTIEVTPIQFFHWETAQLGRRLRRWRKAAAPFRPADSLRARRRGPTCLFGRNLMCLLGHNLTQLLNSGTLARRDGLHAAALPP